MTARQSTLTKLRQNTPDWVDQRRDFIGSSDLPVITGNTPYGTSVFALWAIKTRAAEPDPIDPDTQELFDLGHALEDDIAERYTIRTGRPVRQAKLMRVSKSIPWAAASIDRVSAVRGERRIIEVKWVPYRHWLAEPERVPSYVQDQVQWQLLVTGYDVADVAVLDGGRVYIHEIEPDPDYQSNLVYIAKWFRNLVVKEIAPPIDGSEATRKTLARLHPVPTLDLLDPTPESDALAEDLRQAIAALKVADARESKLKNVVRLMLGDHVGIEGDDYRFSWTNNADSVKTDWKAVAAAYRAKLEDIAARGLLTQRGPQLLAELDPIESLHSMAVDGPRVLRTKFRDTETGKWT